MTFIQSLITEHIDIWTSSIKTKSTTGRGSSKKFDIYGIKKLRELILQLAVMGKLVPQDPNDEPASVLLEKIALEKERLIKEKKIKNPKALPQIEESERPFDLPVGWEWSRLQNVSSYIQRGKGPKYAEKGKVNVISQKCIQWSGFSTELAKYVEDSSLEKYQKERYLLQNDLLWNSTGTGTVGRINVINSIEEKVLVADSHVTVIRPLVMVSELIRVYIASPSIQNRIDPEHESSLVSGTTKQVELNTSVVNMLTVPIPPLQEQKRIVAKVDELMVLCDNLENQTENSIASHKILVETLLSTLTNSQSHQEFTQNWTRISDHFHTLFTTEHSIDQLKKTILQLAVMGKLVPQNPTDEPASVLLEKIAQEKERLIKERRLKRGNLTPQPITLSQSTLRSTWSSCKADDILFVTKLAGFEYSKYITLTDIGEVPVIRAQNVRPFKIDKSNLKYIDKKVSKILDRCALIKSALLVTFIGAGIGDVAHFNEKCRWHLAPNVAKMELFEGCEELLDLMFLNIYLQSMSGKKELFKHMKVVAQPSLSMNTIRDIDFHIPPLQEQKRIVSKVDELMSLCDQLKSNLIQARQIQLDLTDTIVNQVVS